MKTTTTLTEEQARRFKRSYQYKMGGVQTLQFPNGQSFRFDDREYYSGRGAKYNSSIRHDDLGIIEISRKEVTEYFRMMRESEKRRKENLKKQKETEKRIAVAKQRGVYSLKDIGWATSVELSDEEAYGKHFDAERLARTLDISLDDAALLRSEGKTYVIAKTNDGRYLQLYHPSLSCNPLHITVKELTEEQVQEQWSEAEHDRWAAAPFAHLVGQSDSRNHFVC